MVCYLAGLVSLAKLAFLPHKGMELQVNHSSMGEESEPIGERDIVKLVIMIVVLLDLPTLAKLAFLPHKGA